MEYNVQFMELMGQSVRSCLLGWSCQLMVWIILMTLMKRKRSFVFPVVWSFARHLYLQILVEGMLRFCALDRTQLALLEFSGRLVFLAAEIFLLCDMFRTRAVKVIAGEAIGASFALGSLLAARGLGRLLAKGRWTLPAAAGRMEEALLILMAFFLFALVYLPLRKVLEGYRGYEIRHGTLVWTAGIALALIRELFCVREVPESIWQKGGYLAAAAASVGLFFGSLKLFDWWLGQRIREEDEFLNLKYELLDSYYAEYHREFRRIQEEGGEDLLLGGRNDGNETVREYLEHLKQEYDRIQVGIYCDDWILDVFLYCETEMMRLRGIELVCSVQGFGGEELETGQLLGFLHEFLEIAQKNLEQGKSSGTPVLKLCIGSVRNQLIATVSLPAGEKYTGGYRIHRFVKKYHGTANTEAEWKSGTLTVAIPVER